MGWSFGCARAPAQISVDATTEGCPWRETLRKDCEEESDGRPNGASGKNGGDPLETRGVRGDDLGRAGGAAVARAHRSRRSVAPGWRACPDRVAQSAVEPAADRPGPRVGDAWRH